MREGPQGGEPGTGGALGEERGVPVDLRVIVLWALVPPCLVRSVGSSLSGGSDQGHFLAGVPRWVSPRHHSAKDRTRLGIRVS